MENKSVLSLNGKSIGDGYQVYLTAEAGATHTGLDSAKQLVDIAIDAGFDAVKFQMVDHSRSKTPDELFGDYRLEDILRQRELNKDEWLELIEYCQDKNVFMFYTVQYRDMLKDGVLPVNETYKIASRQLKDLDLIAEVSKECKVIQLDTGGADEEDIIDALAIIKDTKCILHHCPVGYPAKPENENLSKIKQYKSLFGHPVAYSSHTASIEMDVMALALGANLLEVPIRKTDSQSISPENEYALTPREAKFYVKTIRQCERAL